MCVGEFGTNAELGSKWSASKIAVAAAGWSSVPCRVSERRLWAWAMRERTTFDIRVSTSSGWLRCWIVDEPNAESHE